jgi:hypothetical protein
LENSLFNSCNNGMGLLQRGTLLAHKKAPAATHAAGARVMWSG